MVEMSSARVVVTIPPRHWYGGLDRRAAFAIIQQLQQRFGSIFYQFDTTPFTQGQVDGWFSFITNEPIDVGIAGVKTYTFLLNDFHYPEVGNVFIVNTDTLKTSRDKIEACMVAELMGWRTSIQQPALGAQLSATKYGQGLTTSEQTLESKAQNQLIATGDALTAGLFYVTPAAQDANVKTLALGGTTVTTKQLFDMSVLDDIYKAHPELKIPPTPGS